MSDVSNRLSAFVHNALGNGVYNVGDDVLKDVVDVLEENKRYKAALEEIKGLHWEDGNVAAVYRATAALEGK